MMPVPSDWEWDNLLIDAKNYMNSKGSNRSHLVATSNKTIRTSNSKEDEVYEDGAIVLVVSWEATEKRVNKEIDMSV